MNQGARTARGGTCEPLAMKGCIQENTSDIFVKGKNLKCQKQDLDQNEKPYPEGRFEVKKLGIVKK